MASYKKLLFNEYDQNRTLLDYGLIIKRYLDELGDTLRPDFREELDKISAELFSRTKKNIMP